MRYARLFRVVYGVHRDIKSIGSQEYWRHCWVLMKDFIVYWDLHDGP